MLVSTILTRCRIALQDNVALETGVVDRWPDAEKMMYLSDGLRELVTLVPEAYSDIVTLTVAPNKYRQSLPDGTLRLLDISRNLGVDGVTPGSMIRIADRKLMDLFDTDWPTATTATAIEHYLYDFKQPRKYMVYPTPTVALKLEAVVSLQPAEVTDATTTLVVDDTYVNSLTNYVLYRCYAKDAEAAANASLATQYHQLFESGLNAGVNATTMRAPNDTTGASEA